MNMKEIIVKSFIFHSIIIKHKSLSFDENSIIKNAFHKDKIPINIDEVDIKRMILSDNGNKDSYKYFIGHIHNGNVFPAPLCIRFPQMNGYSKCFDKNKKYVNLLVKNK